MLHTARHVTLRRAPDLPQVSRPGNKQASVVRIGTEGDLPASNTSCAFCIILHHFTHHEKRWKTSNNHHRFVETWHDWNIFFYIVKYWNTHEIHRHNEIWKMMWNVTMTWIRPRRQVKAWAVPRYAEQMQSRCRAQRYTSFQGWRSITFGSENVHRTERTAKGYWYQTVSTVLSRLALIFAESIHGSHNCCRIFRLNFSLMKHRGAAWPPVFNLFPHAVTIVMSIAA